jgi:cysteine synthase
VVGDHQSVPLDSILEAIGRTPLVRLSRFGRDLPVELYGKVEACNPGGSAKDRLAAHLIRMAEHRGLLAPGDFVIEASAGNTGVGLAMVSAVRGYRCMVVVPYGTSADKLAVVKALGAEIYECREDEDYEEAAEQLARAKKAFRPDQFHTPDNPEAHGQSTALELWDDLGGQIDALVSVCGTGGTLAGIGRTLRQKNPQVVLVRVLPVSSIAGEDSKIEGVAPEGPPPSFACPALDAEFEVNDEESFAAAARLARTEGILIGGSAGAALAGAIRYAQTKAKKDAKVVVILPDTARNYLTRAR